MQTSVDILNVGFHLISDDDAFARIAQWCRDEDRRYICVANPHSVMLCRRNAEMYQATTRASLVLPDGIGILLAAKILNHPDQGRVTGPSLMLKVSDEGRELGLRHYFLGGAPGIAERLADRLCSKFSGMQVAGTCSPPFRDLTDKEDEELVRGINATHPDVLWVGLGAPKQEKWMAEHSRKVSASVMIGVGAAFDFHSGNVPWAPKWMRDTGLEWLHRFACDPRRMWRRNLDSPRFLALVVMQRLRTLLGNGPEQRRVGDLESEG